MSIELTEEEKQKVYEICERTGMPLHEVWRSAEERKQGWYYKGFEQPVIVKRICWNCGVPLKRVTRKGDISYFKCPKCKKTVKIEYDC